MDNTGRVGNISASTSISSGNSGESSRGKTGNSYRVGNIGDTISGSNGGSKTSTIAKTSIAKSSTISNTSIAKTGSIAKSAIAQTGTISIGSIKNTSISLGLSSSKSCKANHKSNLNHVHPVTVKFRIPMYSAL